MDRGFPCLCRKFLAEKKPGEIGSIMLYAHPVQKIAESCGDQATLQYDDKFHYIKVSSAFPWQMSDFIRKQKCLA